MLATGTALFVLSATNTLMFFVAATTTDNPVGVTSLVVQLGLSGVFLWQWRSERDQRIRRDDQVIGILERQGPVLAEAVDTLRAVQESQRAVVIRTATEWDRMADDLRSAHDALAHEVRQRNRGGQ